MLNCSIFTIVLLTALPLVAACAPPQKPTPTFSPAGANLSSTDALVIAEKTATDEGLQLKDYEIPTVVYDASSGEGRWWAHFDGKREMFGDHFSVCIADGARAAQLHLGR